MVEIEKKALMQVLGINTYNNQDVAAQYDHSC